MKLIIQIPCLDEATTLPLVLKDIPDSIPGIDTIETLVIDDGSTDDTAKVAAELGVTHIVRNTSNLGLAFSFRKGLDECIKQGADIIVNIDGDNQYKSSEIPKLVAPILEGKADIVLGNRNTGTIKHFSFIKKVLQKLGTSVVQRLAGTEISDAVTGFRAFSRSATMKLTILSNFTYTIESILQIKAKGLTLSEVSIQTNPKSRESRLFSSMRVYIAFSIATILRIFTMYNPLRVFVTIGLLCILAGTGIGIRFLYSYFTYGGSGQVQSLILTAIFILGGLSVLLVGLIADLIQFNRRLLEDVLERIKRLESKSIS